MEKQEKAMRPIPKNVRQIGERDEEIKLYIEDYVNTFIRKCARSDKLILGALIGDSCSSDGKDYVFVEGAVLAEGFQVADGRVKMTDESWSGLYEKISEFFSGRSVCGWFICSGESEDCNVGMIRSFMYENIGQDKRALIIHNAEIEEETFCVYDQDMIREQQGYYLFYERNEAMQSYMVTTVFAARTDPVAVDAVTTHVRTRIAEKKELPEQKGGYSFVSAAALVTGVIALAAGIVMMSHYEQLREMESVLTNLSGNLLFPQDETGESPEETGSGVGGLIVEDVDGKVNPLEQTGKSTEGSGETKTETPSGSGEVGGQPGTEPESGNESQSGTNPEGGNGNQAGTQPEGGDGSHPGTQPEGGNGNHPGTQPESGNGNQSGTKPEGGNGNQTGTQPEGGNGSQTGTQPEGGNEAGEANAPVSYRSYLVEKGDTLVIICWKMYGYRDDELIQQICEINQLEDKDHIYAGQELLLP